MSTSHRPATSDVRLFSRFVVVGLATAAVYFALFAILEGLLGWDYRLAVSLAYIAGVAFHFIVNRNVTFNGRGGHVGGQLIRYGAVAGINYAVTILVTAGGVGGLPLSA